MASAGTVTVDFAAETAKFTAELKKVQGSLKGLEGNFNSLSKIATTAQRLFVGSVFASFARSAFAAADATADAANRAGIAVDTFSRLQFAAKMADADINSLTGGIQKLQVALSKAGDDNQQAVAALAQLSLTSEQLKGLKVDQQLALIADQFAKVRDPADQTRIAVDLFGRSAGPDLVPLLRQGQAGLAQFMAEADRLGVTITERTAAGIDIADQAVKRFVESTKGVVAGAMAEFALLLTSPANEEERLLRAIRDVEVELKTLADPWKGAVGDPAEIAAVSEQLAILKLRLQELRGELAPLQTSGQLLPLPWTERVQEVTLDPKTPERMKEVDEFTQALLDFDVAVQKVKDARWQTIFDDSTLKAGLEKAQEDADKQVEDDIRRTMHSQDEQERIKEYFRKYDLEQQEEAAAARVALEKGVYAAGIDALQTFSGESEKAAKALVIINKMQAIAQAIQNTAVAVTKAYAQGGIYGIAMAAGMAALGAAQIAMIVRSGYGQMQGIQKHGGAPIGTPVNPAHTTPVATAQEQGEDIARTVQVVINGNFFGSRETVDYLMEAMREQIDSKDVVLFSANSQQARELRPA
jgi:hypothetical protein